jgi:hypothetical protein
MRFGQCLVWLCVFLSFAAVWAPLCHAEGERRVGVLEFRNPAGLPTQEVDYVTEIVRTEARRALPRDRYLLLTKENIQELLPPDVGVKGLESCTGECEVEIGRKIGVHYLVTGEIVRFGDELRVTVRLYDAQTGNLLESQKVKGKRSIDLEEPLEKVALSLFAMLPGAKTQFAAPPVRAEPAPTPSPVAEAPRPSVPPPVVSARQCFAEGITRFQNYDYANAKKNLTQALLLGGLTADETVQARLALATIEASVNNKPAAEEHFREILRAKPSFVPGSDSSPAVQNIAAEITSRQAAAQAEILIAKGKQKRTAGIVLFSTLNVFGILFSYMASAQFDDEAEYDKEASEAESDYWEEKDMGLDPSPTGWYDKQDHAAEAKTRGTGYAYGGALPSFLIANVAGITLWVIGQKEINAGRETLKSLAWFDEHKPNLLVGYNPANDFKTFGLGFRW